MTKYENIIIFLVTALLIVVSAARCCDAAGRALDDDDYQKNFTRCQKRLDEGAPRCWKDVYFTTYLPLRHAQCCRNLLKMDEEREQIHNCWYYLFDDPSTTGSLELNLVRCRLEREPPAARRNGTFTGCVSLLNEGAPDCWQKMYFKHELPDRQGKCCETLMTMDFWGHSCLAYLFDDQKAIILLKDALKKCRKH